MRRDDVTARERGQAFSGAWLALCFDIVLPRLSHSLVCLPSSGTTFRRSPPSVIGTLDILKGLAREPLCTRRRGRVSLLAGRSFEMPRRGGLACTGLRQQEWFARVRVMNPPELYTACICPPQRNCHEASGEEVLGKPAT